MRKGDVKVHIRDFLLKHPDTQALVVASELNFHKSTVVECLQEMENDFLVVRRRESYQVYWSVKPIAFTPQMLLRRRWNADTLKGVSIMHITLQENDHGRRNEEKPRRSKRRPAKHAR